MNYHTHVRKRWKLNEAAGAEAFSLPESQFAELVEQSDCVVERWQGKPGGKLSGFLLSIGAGRAVENFGYMWFQTRFDNFLYVDRVVMVADARRRGMATAMLMEVLQWCRERGIDNLVCQVRDRPANPAGHALCKKLGFTPLESVMLPSRDIVTMYQRSTAIATP
ncbi:MAG: GNAT family N-acetyltransferase [Gammaproteobacteria bacterium]|nr:GNAT family N-acetyltransferase [Gammaproteobacteria bacterium]